MRSASGSLASTRSAPRFLASRDRGLERPGILGVGDVVGHIGEVAVGRALGFEDVDAGEARGLQRGGHRGLADAVQRRVDDRQVAAWLTDSLTTAAM